MRVLVARPLLDSQRTAERLAEQGHQVVVAPLFHIRLLAGPELQLDGVQAILATSGNGIRALAPRSRRRDIKILAVGSETAAVARLEGFIAVADGAGDAKTLARLARETLRPESGVLLHATGADASPELTAELTRAGFQTRSIVLYETVAAPELPGNATKALRENALDAVLVFSPRSAQLLVECVERAGLSSMCTHLHACCISRAAAEALRGLTFAAIHVAAHPDQASLLALLDQIGGPGNDVPTPGNR